MTMDRKNYMRVVFPAKSENESLARILASSMAAQLDPTLEEISDLRTAVSEAVTNCIIHGYKEDSSKEIEMICELYDNYIVVTVADQGCGIADVQLARKPLYTTDPENERSGMGFTIMESFSDELDVESAVNKGTKVRIKKIFHSLGKG
jgi:stage II sporulation protein AB (anti-sigma F factor)